MTGIEEVKPRMEVVDVAGFHVGFVESVECDHIRLMRDEPDPAAPHHRVPLAWVAGVGQTVRLDRERDRAVPV